MSPRVSFLICGVQKSGTSALDRYLRAHPQLFLPDQKELHFFDNEALSWPNPDLQELHQHFSQHRPTPNGSEFVRHPLHTAVARRPFSKQLLSHRTSVASARESFTNASLP